MVQVEGEREGEGNERESKIEGDAALLSSGRKEGVRFVKVDSSGIRARSRVRRG